ncbi:MAG: alpha-N-arabinofuranosidase [Vicinamibacteria bacterium]|nr:alpha-N-arabinofuranosidase [Vicinamibacteria bacterium]
MERTATWLVTFVLVVGLVGKAAAQPVAATIDASRIGQPITPWVFGGFMEPATTRVWAEMLSDRKFFNRITSRQNPTAVTGGFGRRGSQRRWLPVGSDEFVVMDKEHAYVGEWSPLIRLDPATPHGVSQSGLALRGGRAYAGRVALLGSPDAKVSISLIWGPNASDRQTVNVPALTASYAKIPLKFTAKADSSDGRLEIVGIGKGSFRIGVVSLMPADNVSGFKAATIRYLKELGIEIARWPGGNFVSAYDWRDGIGERDKRPPRRELAWNGLESNDMGIDDFITFCRLIGATPYLAVNSGLGDAHSAAAEVEYVNGPATTRLGQLRASNGHPEPYDVKIWGVGNEMYGPWQWGHMSIRQYPEKHNLMVKAMRDVDPTIKVIASGATPEEASWCYIENRQFDTFEGREKVSEPLPFAFGSSQDWTGALLKTSADHIDFLGEHFYGYPNLVIDLGKEQFVESDEPLALKVRRLSNRVQFKFEAWEEYLKGFPYLKDKNIKFAFDEWSPRNRGLGGGPPPVSHSMLYPLTNALVYHEFFRHSDMVGLAVATGGMGALAIDTHGDAIGLRMEGLVMKLLHDHFTGALPVAVSGNAPQLPTKGVVAIDASARPSGSPTFPLDIFAALSAGCKKMAVSVVNPTETPQECDLNFEGVQVGGPAKIYQLTAPVGAPPAPAGFGRFSGPPATMAEISLPEVPRKITLPPMSMTVCAFDAR